jgi:type IV secretion system protein VirB10
LNTDLPGLFRCKLPEPVFGASGKVQLLDRGTWMVGELRDPLKRGQRRGFAVMTRIETPQSCIVKLRAPIGDQIGAAGIDMDIDTHFFERFKSYAAIALIDMISQGGAQALGNLASNGNKNSGNGGVGLSFNSIQSGGQQLGQSAFGDDINIPSTGTTPQARRITVLPMSDIDMRGCYQLRTAGGTR